MHDVINHMNGDLDMANIACPCCKGAGTVDESYLDKDFVQEVVTDYARIFKEGTIWVYEYYEIIDSKGVRRVVEIRGGDSLYQEWHDYTLAAEFFERDPEKRVAIMLDNERRGRRGYPDMT